MGRIFRVGPNLFGNGFPLSRLKPLPQFPNKFVATGLLLLPLTLFADYQAGLDAYSHGDYGTAMREWRAVTDGPATAENPAIFVESHYAVAMLYWQGQGVEQDYARAGEWLLKAARLNHAGAQAKLGYMYTDGLSVPQDYGQALEWFEKAAKGGSVDGLYNLGIFHLYGWGVPQDTTMAAQYLATASALGDPEAEEALKQVLRQIENRTRSEPIQLEDLPEPGNAVSVGANSIRDSETSQTEVPGVGADTQSDTEPPFLDETWIRAQNPQHYTIQIMALRSRDSVEGFMRDYAEFAPFAVFTVQKGSNPLHVLLQGNYADVESARAAKERFPREIQRQDALWIRTFGRVQGLIRD